MSRTSTLLLRPDRKAWALGTAPDRKVPVCCCDVGAGGLEYASTRGPDEGDSFHSALAENRAFPRKDEGHLTDRSRVERFIPERRDS
jgi:hypothetical protein